MVQKVANNLDPAAQRWVRTLESAVDTLERDKSAASERDRQTGVVLEGVTQAIAEIRAQQDMLAAQQVTLTEQQAALTAQQEALTAQQGQLSTQQSELTAQQAQLTSQQTTLANQQTQLSNQQTQLTNVVNSIPITRVFRNTATNFAIPSGTSNRVTITVPWETGKTQASVFATASATFNAAGIAPANLAAWRVSISGNNGSWGDMSFYKMDIWSSNIQHTRSLSGTSGSFAVNLQTSAGANHAASVENNAQMQLIVVFS